MDLVKACNKASLTLNEGKMIIAMFSAKLVKECGESFDDIIKQNHSKQQYIKLGLLIRDSCRGLPDDQLTILLSNYILPQFYSCLPKTEVVDILNQISQLEQQNPRFWTLKHLKIQDLTKQAVFDKNNELKNNNSLNINYNVKLNLHNKFDLSLPDGTLVKTKAGLFLGSILIVDNKLTWRWISAVGPNPPIDLEMITPLLPSIFVKTSFDISNQDLSMLLSTLAVLFNLTEVQLIDDKDCKLCLGLIQ